MSFFTKTRLHQLLLLTLVIGLSGCAAGYGRPYGSSGYHSGYYGNGYGNSYPLHQGANYGQQPYGYRQQGGYSQPSGYFNQERGYRHEEHEHGGWREGRHWGDRDRD